MIADMTDLMDERRQHNAEIIGLLKNIRDENRDMAAHSEEHEFLRELIEREKASKELRLAVKTRVIGYGAVTALGAIFTALWLLFKDYLRHTA